MRRKMEKNKNTHTDNRPIPLVPEIESIFNLRNIDEDCDTIAHLLAPYRKSIQEALGKGEHATAVTVFLAILESLTRHFVEDEHYNYFDDMYSPDYVCQDMIEAIIDSAIGGNFPDEEMRRLKEGLEKLKHTEAYEDYGTPYALDMWKKEFNS